MNDAGRIGFVIKGDYDSTSAYDFLDVVYFGSSSYVAKKLTIGNEPRDNSEYWQVLVKNSDSVVTGIKGKNEDEYRNGDVSLSPEDIGAVSVKDSSTSFIYVTLKETGWYRIAKYVSGNNTVIGQGSYGQSCSLSLKRSYNTANNEYHEVSLRSIFQKSTFKETSGFSNGHCLTKIRHVYDSRDTNSYIEVFYNCSGENGLSVNIWNSKTRPTLFWEAIEPIKASETVEGVTVYSEMNLSANTKGDATNSATVNGHTVNSDVPANAVFTDTKVASKLLFIGTLELSAMREVSIPNAERYDLIKIDTNYGYVYSSVGYLGDSSGGGYVFTGGGGPNGFQMIVGRFNLSRSSLRFYVPFSYDLGEDGMSEGTQASWVKVYEITGYVFNAEAV